MQGMIRTGFLVVIALVFGGGYVFAQTPADNLAQSTSSADKQITADHSKFKALKAQFESGPDVTAACLSCHTEAAKQVMQSIHWTWDYTHPQTAQKLGKKRVINAFCGNVAVNEMRCTSCHAGYGWDDVRVPTPQDPTRVDCLVCHDTSGQYAKQDNLAGHPPLAPLAPGAKTITGGKAWAVDLARAAQSVGAPPGRTNCGGCHFYGGGGDNVKHGDLSSALTDPALATDVHMSTEGAGFRCSTCHVSKKHVFAGSRYNTNVANPHKERKPGKRRDVATCDSCHGDAPHPAKSLIGMKLNDHTDRVACQTCHIPEFAKGGVATKTMWDWSTAGKLKDGKPYQEDNFIQSDGKRLHTYLSTKGNFEWAENVTPHYAWFDGQVEYTTLDRTIDPTGRVEVNRIGGDPADPRSRIFPFKRMQGRQAYDTQLNRLVYTHVYGPETDSAFWSNFDWGKSIQAAMAYADAEYSGEYGFVDTYMYWPITHMVAPAREALSCDSCHAENGRLSAIEGVYMPGAKLGIGAKLGFLVLGLSILGVVVHVVLRIFWGTRENGGAGHG